jgi:hypothetical protein
VFPVGGYQVALLDPTTFAPIMSHIYYQILGSGADAEQHIYTDMMTDIAGVTRPGYLAVVAAFGMDLANYPLPAFAQWLSSCGATLSDWKNYQVSTLVQGQASYVCIGKQGLMPGNAVEAFAAVEDYLDNASQGTTDASALALLYAPSTLDRSGDRAYRSLASALYAPA